MSDSPECLRIRDDLAALIDDQLTDDLRSHVAHCDACRDLRHELRQAVADLGGAGGDYRHPEGFAERVLAAAEPKVAMMESAQRASGDAVKKPLFSEQEKKSPLFKKPDDREPVGASSSDARTGTDNASSQRADSASKSGEPGEGGAKVVPIRRSNVGPLLALVGVAAVAALVPVGIKRLRGGSRVGADGTSVAQSSSNGWAGRLALVSRASAERTGGVTVRAPGASAFAPLAEGAPVAAGSELRTDGRTRVRLDLADGSRLVLDRNTTLRLDTVGPRVASLVTGALVADVAHLESAPSAKISLPTGAVTVLGTRFLLTASDDRSTVRVTRGNVRVEGQSGPAAEVKTGMEGVLARNASPIVSPAVDLASSVSWSELGARSNASEADVPVQGLGELRARRPGQTDERDHAVSLVAHRVKVRIVGNLARTEIEEVFRNETGNELEGIYRFPLPPEAQIERLALDVNGVMEQGAFVDKQRAAAIWRGVLRNAVRPMQQRVESEDLVWVPGPWRDPALLEWQRGGRFELRIFPIPARGQRRVSIAYTQTIAPSAGGLRRYVYPLAHDANGSTRVEQFDVDVQVMGHDANAGVRPRGYALTANADAPSEPGRSRLSFSQGAFVPAGDLVVEYAMPDRDAVATAWAFKPTATAPSAVTPDPAAHNALPQPGSAPVAPQTLDTTASYVALALRPQLPRWSESRPRDYAIVVDTSRSMVGERITRASRLARAMITEMDPRDRVTVLACDITCRTMPGGMQFAGAPSVRAAEAFLQAEQPQGATDLVAQVRAAARALPSDNARDQRIVYIGDGAASAGYRSPDRVAREVSEAMPSPRATITTVAIGADADSTLLSAVARAGGGVATPYVPGESVSTAALSVLEATYGVTLRDPSLVLPEGLTEIAPSRIATVRAGSEVIVVARMRGARVQGDAVLRGTVGGEPFETRIPIDVRESTDRGNAFVPRLYAAHRIAELEANGGSSARGEIVQLSQRFRVASRHTSLLVLEGERMYRAFGVERNIAPEADWTGEEVASSTSTVQRGPQGNPAVGTTPPSADPNANSGLVGANAAVNSATTRTVVAERNEQSAQPVGGLDDMTALARAGEEAENVGSLGGGAANGAGAGYFGTRGRGAGAAAAGAGEAAAVGDEDAPVETEASREQRSDALANAGGAADARVATRRARSSASAGASMNFAARPAPVSQAQPTAPQQPMPTRMGLRGFDDQGLRLGLPATPPGNGRWMRRIWVREAAIVDAPTADITRITTARTALALEPDSRAKHRDFYKVLSIAGQFAEADEVARRWTTRDALDPDALVRLAEVAARRGERDVSLRIYAGIADVRANDKAQLQRLVAMFDRAGDSERACSMRISLAEAFSTDLELVAGAVVCERALGRTAAAQRWLDSISDGAQRATLDAAVTRITAQNAANSAASVRGELVVDANWDVPADVDIAVIDPKGARVTWAWGRTRGLTVRDALSQTRESIGLSSVQQSGDYVIEVSRASRNGPSLRGTITVRAMGRTRAFRLSMDGHEDTRRIGAVRITREERLVGVDSQPF
ncbi:MAG: FecR domain-containing protein [Myxococcales bacterium]|nr:FecR domain-containing protein [Myxococcales bacterium]